MHTKYCPHECSGCNIIRDGSTAEKAIRLYCSFCTNAPCTCGMIYHKEMYSSTNHLLFKQNVWYSYIRINNEEYIGCFVDTGWINHTIKFFIE